MGSRTGEGNVDGGEVRRGSERVPKSYPNRKEDEMSLYNPRFPKKGHSGV